MNAFFVGTWICASLTLGLGSGCSKPSSALENRPPAPPAEQARASAAATAASAPAASAVPGVPAVSVPSVSAVATPSAALKVKRLVIASGVQDREPVAASEPLRADGTPIYAFAELSNATGETENVRITFERQGGKERAGDVVLPVPGKVTRHRTWAYTRHIFEPGQWDAVVRSENGAELSRTSFDVQRS